MEFILAGRGLAGGRGLLVILLFVYVGVGLSLFLHAVREPFWRSGSDSRGQVGALELAGVLGATTALVSFATADEYWANFANISRFFIPGCLALCLLPLVVPGRSARWTGGGVCAFLLLFTLSLLYAELRAEPLGFILMDPR